jgi:outer membrane protein assembly factor BamE (lipoprotein component of BamABCDE complex)
MMDGGHLGEAMSALIIIILVVAGGIALSIHATNERRKRLMAKYGDALVVEKIMKKMIWQGMTNDQLVDSLGRPADIDEKVYKTKTVLTYKYHPDGARSFRTRVKVENGDVVGWTQR